MHLCPKVVLTQFIEQPAPLTV